MQKLKVNPLIYRAFSLYFLDSCFLFLLKIKYVFSPRYINLFILQSIHIILPFTFFPHLVSAQPSNDTILKQQLKPYFDATGYQYQTISGFDIQPYFSQIRVDSASTFSIKITPRVLYAKVDKQKYLRELRIALNHTDSSGRAEVFTYRDTLEASTLRKVNRESSKELRSTDPTPLGKYIKPTLLIVGSIGSIFSLFFIRSK